MWTRALFRQLPRRGVRAEEVRGEWSSRSSADGAGGPDDRGKAGPAGADLLEQCQQRVSAGQRVLITTLTKRWRRICRLHSAGGLLGVLHSEIDTLERVEILRDLRLGNFDVLVGVNLLREG